MFSDLHRLYMSIKQTRQKEAGYLERIWHFWNLIVSGIIENNGRSMSCSFPKTINSSRSNIIIQKCLTRNDTTLHGSQKMVYLNNPQVKFL